MNHCPLPNQQFSGINETRFLQATDDYFVMTAKHKQNAIQKQKNVGFSHNRAKSRKRYPVDFDITTTIFEQNGDWFVKVTRV